MLKLRDYLDAKGGTPAHVYERVFVPAFFDAWAVEMAAIATPGDGVLDVACGTGAVTRHLAANVGAEGAVTGLDFLEVMLNAAKEFEGADPSITWIQDTAMALPFDDASFDVVICQQGLQFMPDKAVALSEMWRVLKPGGKLRVAVWCGPEHQPAFKAIENAMRQVMNPDLPPLAPFSFGDAEALKAALLDAGIADYILERQEKVAVFQSLEDLVLGLICSAFRATDDGVVAGVFDLDDADVEAKMDNLLAAAAAGLADRIEADGRIPGPMASHVISAIRPMGAS